MNLAISLIVQTVLVRKVLVSMPSRAGVVHLDDGSLLVTNDVAEGGGTCASLADPGPGPTG